MPITLQHDDGNIYRVRFSGILYKRDLDTVQAEAAARIAERGKIRVLVELANFDGWETGANWNDLSFFIRHGDDIERIAIVGDKEWRSQALMFAGADLRKAEVGYFTMAHAGTAREWLGATAGDAARSAR